MTHDHGLCTIYICILHIHTYLHIYTLHTHTHTHTHTYTHTLSLSRIFQHVNSEILSLGNWVIEWFILHRARAVLFPSQLKMESICQVSSCFGRPKSQEIPQNSAEFRGVSMRWVAMASTSLLLFTLLTVIAEGFYCRVLEAELRGWSGQWTEWKSTCDT
jgi:hypothetical protein